MRRRGGHRRFFGRVRGQPLRYITILPSLVTLLNGACGFAAIVFASKVTEKGDSSGGYFIMAGYMVLVAMVADMLDGRLARMRDRRCSGRITAGLRGRGAACPEVLRGSAMKEADHVQ